MIEDDEIHNIFLKVKNDFPFEGYIQDDKYNHYKNIIQLISNDYPRGSNILSIGSGPCDFEAMLSEIGYNVHAIDDLKDPWHLIGNNAERIKTFAKKYEIDLVVESAGKELFEHNHFDVVLMLDVIEHLHNSPRELLNYGISLLKPGGRLIILTPNAASLYNRIQLLIGNNTGVNWSFFYWTVGEYRSHVREYTLTELIAILKIHNIYDISVTMEDTIYIGDIINKQRSNKFLVGLLLNIYKGFTYYPKIRNSILISGKKPENWSPTELSLEKFEQHYGQINRFNLDGEEDSVIVQKILKSHYDL